MHTTIDLFHDTGEEIGTEYDEETSDCWFKIGSVTVNMHSETYLQLFYQMRRAINPEEQEKPAEEKVKKTGVQSQMEMATGEKAGEM